PLWLRYRGLGPARPALMPPGVWPALYPPRGVRVAGVQHGAGPRPARGDGEKQLGIAQEHGPSSHRLDATRRAGSRDGVRRLRAILARLERRAPDGVREVRRLPAAAGGWQLADGPVLRIRGLDPGEPIAH